MAKTAEDLPDLCVLEGALRSAMSEGRRQAADLRVVSRAPNPYGSSFPSEIVRYQVAGGEPGRVLCKYGSGPGKTKPGHRYGVKYEWRVYTCVIDRLDMTTPEVHGYWEGPDGEPQWLFLEYLDNCFRLDQAPDLSAIFAAAEWLGEFHRSGRAFVTDGADAFLNSYGPNYFRDWIERSKAYNGDLGGAYPWFAQLCDRAADLVPDLLSTDRTIIHGDYYAKNILVRDGEVYPVDWESAAIAAGEIDLAMLVGGWPEETLRACCRAYLTTGVGSGREDELYRRISAAELHQEFRWLGHKPNAKRDGRYLRRFDRLEAVGRRLELL